MRSGSGVVYIAMGESARQEAAKSIETLRARHSLQVTTLARAAEHLSLTQASRWAKVNLDSLSPYEYTLYIDADTLVRGDLSVGFEILADGWDMVIVPSAQQGNDLLWHVTDEERTATLEEIGSEPLQLQAGVFWFAKNERTKRLFAAWRSEYLRYRDQDQGALLRALAFAPVKLWLLGKPWNGGAVIEHRCGSIRRQ